MATMFKKKIADLRRRSRQFPSAASSVPDIAIDINSEKHGTIPVSQESLHSDSNVNSSSNTSRSSRPSLLDSASSPAVNNVPDTNVKLIRRFSSQSYANPGSPNATGAPTVQILSIADGSWVHTSLLLVFGYCGPFERPVDGSLTVSHPQSNFPSTSWPVSDGFFKALVHLEPGPNQVQFELSATRFPTISSQITLHMMPLTSTPPLHLVILMGKDSKGVYDAPPERIKREGNGLEIAERKLRMAAYLWQAFTAEQMNRNRFGRRVFRLEETWGRDSLSSVDTRPRNLARVHVIRTEKTVEELRDLEIAQQNPKGSRRDELFSVAYEAVNQYFAPKTESDRRYVAVLLLDATWDPGSNLIRGHAALGGGSGLIQMGIFGSQSLHAWPSYIEEVTPAFSDCTRVDTSILSNDANESGSNWEAACIGLGAMLHEVGHAFGCPHQADGIMLKSYVTLNRTFVIKESYSTRTKSHGLRVCYPKDECNWHRLDILRFRFHPCFRSPGDPLMQAAEDSPQVYGVSGGLLITSVSGVAWIEIYVDRIIQGHIEVYPKVERQSLITEEDVISRVPGHLRTKPIKLEVFTIANGRATVENFTKSVMPMENTPGITGKAFASPRLGLSQMEGSKISNVVWQKPGRYITAVKVYHGDYLDGMEFMFNDSTSELFGKRGGQLGGSDFPLDTRRGEAILGFAVRSGLWINGLEILTTTGRRSQLFGDANGGSSRIMIPPVGYLLVGVAGSTGSRVDGFSIIYSS